MKKTLLLAGFCLLNNVVFAQINESDTTRFQLRANLTGNYQQGNVTVTTIKSRLDFWYAPVSDCVQITEQQFVPVVLQEESRQ